MKSCLAENTVYNFINSIVEESKYCSDVRKKHFNKELVTTRNIIEIIKTILNAGFMTVIMLMVMLKKEIIVMSLENIKDLHMETAMSRFT